MLRKLDKLSGYSSPWGIAKQLLIPLNPPKPCRKCTREHGSSSAPMLPGNILRSAVRIPLSGGNSGDAMLDLVTHVGNELVPDNIGMAPFMDIKRQCALRISRIEYFGYTPS